MKYLIIRRLSQRKNRQSDGQKDRQIEWTDGHWTNSNKKTSLASQNSVS